MVADEKRVRAIAPERYLNWRVTLSNPESEEVVLPDFYRKADAQKACDLVRAGGRYSRSCIESIFVAPKCDDCGANPLSEDQVSFRVRFQCDELICEPCYKRRRIDFRELAPDLCDIIDGFVAYDTLWNNSTLRAFTERANEMPDMPGVYCLSMPLTDEFGQRKTAMYVGQSTSSVLGRCLDHGTSFAYTLLGPPPPIGPLKAPISEYQHYLGLFYEGHYRRSWHEVLSSHEYSLITKHSQEILFGRQRSSVKGKTRGPAKRLAEFIRSAGAAFNVCALQTFPDIDRDELSDDRYTAIAMKRKSENSNRKRILDAEANWQRELSGPNIVKLWTADTAKRLKPSEI